MRHRKHRHQLGVKKEHRIALVANLAASLIQHGRIRTTLAKAKAVRPFVEKVVTLAKKAAVADNKAKSLHFRRLALSRVRNEDSVRILFNEKVEEFAKRKGGYTRIYKLVPRIGDAAPMAIIELISASDEGYKSSKRKISGSSKKGAKPKVEQKKSKVEEEVADAVTVKSGVDADESSTEKKDKST